MMKFAAHATLLALPFAVVPAGAQPAPPKLIVAISVDQFSADLFAQYRQHFTGGLRRLSEGAVFPSGYQAHAATDTCPGHSTILTGSRPARTGIIGNGWIDPGAAREDKFIYCAEDERIAGSSSNNYTVSSYHLKVPALGDHMKRADPRSRVTVASGKDRSAAMMGGHNPDQRWWWSSEEFTGTGTPRPAAVASVNANVADAMSRSRAALEVPPYCEARSRAVALDSSGKPARPGRFARDAGNHRAFRVSPELDAATLALAAALREEMKLGEGLATDLLILGLAATDYVGHSYGMQGIEMCLQMAELDRSLGDFFAGLDAANLEYLVVLTADHGGYDVPEPRRPYDPPPIDTALAAGKIGESIGARLGLTGRLLSGGVYGDMYIERTLTDTQRQRVLIEAVTVYRAHPQVAAAFTAAELGAAPDPSGPPDTWSLLERAKASFDPKRSGDFVVLLKPRETPVNLDTGRSYYSDHGSPWDYDRRVPILFWRRGLAPFEQSFAVETVDILPTIASLIGLQIPPGTIDGRCLDLAEGPETTCRE